MPTRQTLKMLGIPSSTYYDWYARWNDGGLDVLADRSPWPVSVWNRIPDKVREDVVNFALEHEDLTPRELAVNTPTRSGTLSRNRRCQRRSKIRPMGGVKVGHLRRTHESAGRA